MFDSNLELEGELEITGYIKAMEKFEGYYYEGDIIFLVDENQLNNILILIHPETGNPYKPYTYYSATFQQFSDTPILRLGSIMILTISEFVMPLGLKIYLAHQERIPKCKEIRSLLS